ncbi:MAG TPA: family 16 glycoside hydrolase [Ktedonobacteraceae bacterium]|nr:family 16 glycoside hydrolase [Ktedonobacteraceae bacterium]
MSSMYPSFGGTTTRPCMRCGASLALNESQCSRCGLLNPPPQGQQFGGFQQGQQAGFPGQSWGAQSPQTGNGGWSDAAGSSGAWGSTGQASSRPQNTLFPGQGQPPSQPLQPNLFGNTGNGFANPGQPPSQPLQSNLFGNTGNGFANPGQSSLNSAFANFQQNSSQANNFFTATQQKNYGASPLGGAGRLAQRGLRPNDDDDDRKRPGVGVIVVIIVLVLALVGGGSFAAYKIFKNNGPATVANPTPPPIVTPGGKPLFSDSFQNNNAGWDLNQPDGSKISLAGGKLVLESDNHALYPELLPQKTFADFRIDVDTGLTNGNITNPDPANGYGIYIRASASQSSPLGLYYRFEVYGNGAFVIYKGAPDATGKSQSTALKSSNLSDAVNQVGSGKLNHLTVIARGSQLSFIINGTTVSTFTDTSYKSGAVALFVSQVTDAKSAAQATFENLAVFPAQ